MGELRYGAVGEECLPAAQAAARRAHQLGLPDEVADTCVAVAGALERPPLERVADLERAGPAVFYYATRLMDDAAATLAVVADGPPGAPFGRRRRRAR